MADSEGSIRARPGAGADDAGKASAVPPARAEPTAGRAMGRTQWVVLCLLFLGSSVLSLTGPIFFIGWIVAL